MLSVTRGGILEEQRIEKGTLLYGTKHADSEGGENEEREGE